MADDKTISIKYWLRWAGVLPGAVLIGLLSTFPLHWMLYITLAHGETISGVNIAPIERVIYPAVIAFAYIVGGFNLAPTRKFQTTIVLTFLYLIFFIGMIAFVKIRKVEFNFEARTIGPFIGLFLALFVCWRMSKQIKLR